MRGKLATSLDRRGFSQSSLKHLSWSARRSRVWGMLGSHWTVGSSRESCRGASSSLPLRCFSGRWRASAGKMSSSRCQRPLGRPLSGSTWGGCGGESPQQQASSQKTRRSKVMRQRIGLPPFASCTTSPLSLLSILIRPPSTCSPQQSRFMKPREWRLFGV